MLGSAKIALVALTLSARIGLAQVPKVYSICELIERRHELSVLGVIRVSGIDKGDGALRDDCASSVEIHGIKRPAAAWVLGAEPDYIRSHQDEFKNAITFDEYVQLKIRERERLGRKVKRSIVVIGQLQIKKEDAAISGGEARRMYAGFGNFGLYAVQLVVGFVEVKKVVD